ncbi:MAG TPA: glycosyltransferase family 4 protein [Acidimicrobiales bacterium]|nr:glycosyltransferase family 4 protein [Acidimicrobiales bacterium]
MVLRVRFVVHTAQRSGAPMGALRLVRWLVDTGRARPSVVLREGGPLASSFASLAPTAVIHDVGRARVRTAERGLASLGLNRGAAFVTRTRVSRAVAHLPPADVVYLNGVGAASSVASLRPAGPVVTHVHELALAMDTCSTPAERARLVDVTDRFLAVSEGVAAVLRDDWGVAAERIEVVPAPIDRPPPTGGEADRRSQRRSLGLPPDRPLLLASGIPYWLKGPDLFVQVAARALRLGAGATFCWVGGLPSDWTRDVLSRDARLVGFEDRIRFVAEVPDLSPWLQAATMALVTSREEAFPLFAVEAAAHGVPVLTFAVGGTPELVERGCGAVVPYLDVEAMARRICELLEDPAAVSRLGARGRQLAPEFTVEQVGPRALEALERATGSAPDHSTRR